MLRDAELNVNQFKFQPIKIQILTRFQHFLQHSTMLKERFVYTSSDFGLKMWREC